MAAPVHSFTHLDAPLHVIPDGITTEDIPLERLVGDVAIVDLTPIAPKTAITVEHLEKAGQHIRNDDIVFLKTAWDEQESIATPAFWSESPYMTRPACEWLLGKEISTIGYGYVKCVEVEREKGIPNPCCGIYFIRFVGKLCSCYTFLWQRCQTTICG